MQTRPLGSTGHETSLAVLGGIAFHHTVGEAAERLLATALEAGVTTLDIAPGYGDAEVNVGPYLPAVRSRLFVAGKTFVRDPDGARTELERSLERLGIDSFDCYQLHGLLTVEDLDERGPVLDMMLRARDEGLCRFVGTTGHDLQTAAAQTEALRRYDLATVMLPVNPRMASHTDYWRDLQSLLDTCQERQVGVLAIKAGMARAWQVPPEERTAPTWYEPLVEEDDLRRSIRFALSQPGVSGIPTPGVPELVPTVVRLAAEFSPMTAEEQRAAVAAAAHEPSLFPVGT